jgi:hypothetical protein
MNDLNEKYLGKHLLVGLTYLNKDESLKERIQLHGIITRISENTIVFKRKDDGQDFSIPFDEENLEAGQPEAVYELKSTGEAIESVGFIGSWTIYPPEEGKDL